MQGREVVVLTDHCSLKHFLIQSTLNPRQARWLDLVAEFNLDIRYRKGADNQAADSLSRVKLLPTICTSRERPAYAHVCYSEEPEWFLGRAREWVTGEDAAELPLGEGACWSAFLHPEAPPTELLNATAEGAVTFHDACIAAYPTDDEFGAVYGELVGRGGGIKGERGGGRGRR